jgi:hypothetical protein
MEIFLLVSSHSMYLMLLVIVIPAKSLSLRA